MQMFRNEVVFCFFAKFQGLIKICKWMEANITNGQIGLPTPCHLLTAVAYMDKFNEVKCTV